MYSPLLAILFALLIPNVASRKYEPNWDSLDTRPLPEWFDNAKIGIFIHWGVFAVPSMGEWFWSSWKTGNKEIVDYLQEYYPEKFTYQEFAKDFRAEFFNATQWADLFAKSGAKYIVLTSKHHEGYTLWPSKYSYSWNAKDIGPERDVVQELSEAVRDKNLTFGLYHSLYEWFNPMYLSDKASNFTTKEFVFKKMLPEMKELVETYEPAVLWSDGDWEAHDGYWNSTEFLAWLYSDSSVKDYIVTNDRWGIGIPCKHGDFYSCKDRYNPGTLQPHKWENAMTLDKDSWGFRRNAKLSDYFTINELLFELATTVSCGGNLLVNVGPSKDGTITPIFEERLTQLGQWLEINGEAVYESQPWTAQNDSLTLGVWYTSKSKAVYSTVLHWPRDGNILPLASVVELFGVAGTTVTLLGNEDDGHLDWKVGSGVVYISFPDRALVKSEWAWVLKIVPETNDV